MSVQLQSGKCDKPHTAIREEYTTFYKTDEYIYEQTKWGFIEWSIALNTWKALSHVHTNKFTENPEYQEYRNGKNNGVPKKVETVLYPIKDETVESGQITLSEFPQECEDLMSIIKEIEEKAKKWIYISPEEWQIFRVQIRIAVASWFLFVFDNPDIPERIAGLLGSVGVSAGGKKRLLTLLRMIAYRPIYTLNSTKIPSTYRLVEPWGHASLLVDEADQKETGSEQEWIQFFNARYDGTPIPRYNSATQQIDTFHSFGLTGFALRRLPRDEGIVSRMIKINATSSPVVIDEIAGTEIYNDFASVRNRLLYLRLKYYGKLQFVGKSGLPVGHSWRGKENLVLIRVMAQIDPEIEKDIVEVSQKLTEREVENLSQTWDGMLINEIFDFISDEGVEAQHRKGAIFFIKRYEGKEEERIMVLNLSRIAKSLDATASDVHRSLVQFKIDTFERFRVESIKFPQRGVLVFRHLEDTDRIFQHYVPRYNHELLGFMEQGKLDTLVNQDKPETKENPKKKGEKAEVSPEITKELNSTIAEVKENFQVMENECEIDQYNNFRIAIKKPQGHEQFGIVRAFMKGIGFTEVTSSSNFDTVYYIKKVNGVMKE